MAKLPVVDWQRKIVGDVEVSEGIVNTPYQPYLVRDAVVHYRAGLRMGTHSTKTVSTVSGSNIKPWKQKGTGRARAGNTRSPVWRHGAVALGPQPRDYSFSLNKKVLKKAMLVALSEKTRSGQLEIINQMEGMSAKTRDLAKTLALFGSKKIVVVFDKSDLNFMLAVRNLPTVSAIHVSALNVYHVVNSLKVLFIKDALPPIEKRLVL